MSRKRRMFDIELPAEEPQTFLAGKANDRPQRRGPMATAIAETAESARDRARIESEIRAENDALAQEHLRLKHAGLIADLIPLDAIDTHKLIRTRAPAADFELAEPVQSIRDIGPSNPIRVEPARAGSYELIHLLRGHGAACAPLRNGPAAPSGRAKTTFQIPRPWGNGKCTAANSRLKIRLPPDFSAIDRRKLEAAGGALLDQIG